MRTYEAGKAYFCSYWRQYFYVLSVTGDQSSHKWLVTVLWDDTRITSHCTYLAKGDRHVMEEEFWNFFFRRNPPRVWKPEYSYRRDSEVYNIVTAALNDHLQKTKEDATYVRYIN